MGSPPHGVSWPAHRAKKLPEVFAAGFAPDKTERAWLLPLLVPGIGITAFTVSGRARLATRQCKPQTNTSDHGKDEGRERISRGIKRIQTLPMDGVTSRPLRPWARCAYSRADSN